jgi:hypothetical protein
MRTSLRKSNTLFTSLVALAICVGIMVCAPLMFAAHVPASSITVVNNSGREIHHLYLSAPDQNNWGSDQLVNSVIPPNGGSFTLSNVSCSGSTIKVIAEDQEGCFSYQVVSCSEASTWTITNDTSRDCGN